MKPPKIDFVLSVVRKHYPTLESSVRIMLAVFGSMAFKDRTKPLSLIFETPSGYGKTTVLQMAFPLKGSELKKVVYRSDKFTPKAFVSHAANVTRDDLKKTVDLLPKIEGKVLVTKELAPLFRGEKNQLLDTFSILIPILDGKGFTSDSGVHGQRGYDRPIVFNWLGATTPLPKQTHKLMSQLGTRLLFWEVPVKHPTSAELLAYAQGSGASGAEGECQTAVNDFLSAFFTTHHPASVPYDLIRISRSSAQELARAATLIATCRAEITHEREGGWKPVGAGTPEGPWKVVDYLRDLARGHALLCGRERLAGEDTALALQVAVSSIPIHLRPLVKELRQHGRVSSTRAEKLCGASRPTARNYLQELSLLGIGRRTKGSPKSNVPDAVNLSPKFGWLRQGP